MKLFKKKTSKIEGLAGTGNPHAASTGLAKWEAQLALHNQEGQVKTATPGGLTDLVVPMETNKSRASSLGSANTASSPPQSPRGTPRSKAAASMSSSGGEGQDDASSPRKGLLGRLATTSAASKRQSSGSVSGEDERRKAQIAALESFKEHKGTRNYTVPATYGEVAPDENLESPRSGKPKRSNDSLIDLVNGRMQLRAGTFEEIMKWIIFNNVSEHISSFLITFRAYGTPADLWAAYLNVFRIVEENDKTAPAIKADLRKKVLGLLGEWIDRFSYKDFKENGDMTLFKEVTRFFKTLPAEEGRRFKLTLIQKLREEDKLKEMMNNNNGNNSQDGISTEGPRNRSASGMGKSGTIGASNGSRLALNGREATATIGGGDTAGSGSVGSGSSSGVNSPAKKGSSVGSFSSASSSPYSSTSSTTSSSSTSSRFSAVDSSSSASITGLQSGEIVPLVLHPASATWASSSRGSGPSGPPPSIHSFGSKVVAEQMTYIDALTYAEIQPEEMLRSNWTRPNKEEVAPTLTALARQFNMWTGMVATDIILASSLNDQAKMVTRYIRVMIHLNKLNNFQSLMAIMAGLNCSSISRLRKVQERVPVKYKEEFMKLESLMEPRQNFLNYRQRLADTHGAQQPIVPYLVVFLRDLTFINDGNQETLPVDVDDDDEGDGSGPRSSPRRELPNFEKMVLLGQQILELQAYRKAPYGITPHSEVISLLRTARHMDEDSIHRRSIEQEPPLGSSSSMDEGSGKVVKNPLVALKLNNNNNPNNNIRVSDSGSMVPIRELQPGSCGASSCDMTASDELSISDDTISSSTF